MGVSGGGGGGQVADRPLDCRSPDGVTVGLIDSLMAISRVLAIRLRLGLPGPQVAEALADLRQDEDVREILGGG